MESVNYNKLLKCPHHSASPAIHFSNKTSPTEVNFHVGCVLLQSNSFHWKLFLSINKPFLSELPQQHKQAFLHFFTNKPSTIFISKVATMFSLTSMPSTASVLSTYTTFAASAMLVRTVLNEVQNMTSQLVPNQLQEKILAGVGDFFGYSSSQMTLIIEEYNGFSINQMYESSETYLRTKVTPSVEKLRVSKSPREKKISVTINKGEKVVDVFGGIQLKWQMICTVSKQTSEGDTNESRSIELSFHKKYMEKVLNFYLPHVMNTSKAIKEENKVVKLYSLGSFGGEFEGGVWGFTNLDHPSTFDTLAMDPVLKKELIDDLERFVKRRNFY